MKIKLFIAALALVGLLTPTKAQDQPLDVSITSSPSNPHGCGRVSYPLYCYGIPITVNGQAGTIWLDSYYLNNSGFVLFNVQNPDGSYAYLTTANITSQVLSSSIVTYGTHSSVQITSATFGLQIQGDPDSDQDDDSGNATLTINFTYTYGCSGGRGYSCFWVRHATDGSITGLNN